MALSICVLMSILQGAMGWSVICDCGISWSYFFLTKGNIHEVDLKSNIQVTFTSNYCKFRIIRGGEGIFAKLKPSRNCEITLSLTGVDKSC